MRPVSLLTRPSKNQKGVSRSNTSKTNRKIDSSRRRRATRDGFTLSVHRPDTVIGYAPGNAMNMGQNLAIYATLSRHTGQPFVFPRSAVQWNGLTDMTDARVLARHLE
jgi:hypothetical protein